MRSHFVEREPLSRARFDRRSIAARVARIVDYLFGVVYTLLLVRLVLEFFNARPQAGFVQLIRRLTDALYSPFRGMFATSIVDGQHIVWPLAVAVLGYMILHAMMRALLRVAIRE